MISNENVVKKQNISNENVEILNIFKNIINNYSTNSIFDFEDYEITYVQVKSLLDYITNLQEKVEQKENIIKNIKAQLEYLETYSSKEDVFEDMKRRLDRIEKIIGDSSDE